MAVNLNWLDACSRMQEAIEQSKSLLVRMEQPYLTDKRLIPEVHELLKPYLASYDKGTAVRAEMLILLYLFAPSRLIRQKQGRFQIMTDIARVMGLQRSNAYMYKVALIHTYRYYDDFRKLVDEGLRIVAEHYGIQGEIMRHNDEN